MNALAGLEPKMPDRPFFVHEARDAGLTWDSLQTEHYVRLSRGQYASAHLRQNIQLSLRGVALRMPPTYAFSGPTAAWILGVDLPACEPIEVTVDRSVSVRRRAGVKLRRAGLDEAEVIVVDGLRTTCALRTARDLGSIRDPVESVVALEMALHAGIVELRELVHFVAANAGDKGIKRLRRATVLAEPRSESPIETRLRMQLISARLPRPVVQADLHDAGGRFLGRADLYYPDRRLVIEYDGAHHRDRLVADLRRQNTLLNAGYHILRFTAADLRAASSVVTEVRKARARLPVTRGASIPR